MTTRTVIHDGLHDDDVEELARFHGAVHVAAGTDSSWQLTDATGAVHTVPLGASLVCTHTRRKRFFSVHQPLPEPQCRLQIKRVDGLWWEGRIRALDEPTWGSVVFCRVYVHANAIRRAAEVQTALRSGCLAPCLSETRN